MSDPLDDLRDAYRDLDAPSLEQEPDAATREALDWMRAAWSSLEAPPVQLAPRRRWVSALPLVSGLAAAALVLFSLGGLQRSDRPSGGPSVAPHLDLQPVRASIRHDGEAELRAGLVTLVLLDESATPTDQRPEHRNPGEDR